MNVPHSIRLSHLGRNNQLHMCSVTNIIQRNQPASRYRRTMIYKHIALSEKSGNRRRSNRISKLIHNSRTIHIGYIRFHPSNSYQPLFFKAHQNQIIRFNCICRIRRTFIHNLHIHPACQLHILIPAYIRCRILRIEFTLRNNDNATIIDKSFDGIFFLHKHIGIRFRIIACLEG